MHPWRQHHIEAGFPEGLGVSDDFFAQNELLPVPMKCTKNETKFCQKTPGSSGTRRDSFWVAIYCPKNELETLQAGQYESASA